MHKESSRKCSKGVSGGPICLRQGIARKMSDNCPEGRYAIEKKVLNDYRKARFESQTCFWARFGVTQSRGSRYEMGMAIPHPIAILLKLYFDGVISNDDLSPIGKSTIANLRICGKCWQSV